MAELKPIIADWYRFDIRCQADFVVLAAHLNVILEMLQVTVTTHRISQYMRELASDFRHIH
jgi:hypothetical protein